MAALHSIRPSRHLTFSQIPSNEMSSLDSYWWRIMVAFSCIPSLLSVFLWGVVFKNYESPVWLVRNSNRDDAKSVLQALRPGSGQAEAAVRQLEVDQGNGGGNRGFRWAVGVPI